jgi:hypothetical protein
MGERQSGLQGSRPAVVASANRKKTIPLFAQVQLFCAATNVAPEARRKGGQVAPTIPTVEVCTRMSFHGSSEFNDEKETRKMPDICGVHGGW